MFLIPILLYYLVEVDMTSLFDKLLIFLLDCYLAPEHIGCFVSNSGLSFIVL